MLCRVALVLAVIAGLGSSLNAVAEEEEFVLPPSPGRDPFVDARINFGNDDDDSGHSLSFVAFPNVSLIIGRVDSLTAAVDEAKVRSGDKVKTGKSIFLVEKITKHAVHIKLLKAERRHEKYVGRSFVRKINR